MMDLLISSGFSPVFVLDGPTCGVDQPTLIIAVMAYAAEREPAAEGAWIHPYYPVSQRAYRAAARLAAERPELTLRNDIRVKPLFARMPGLSQGRNTLSYLPEIGSRFHVQIFTCSQPLTPNVTLLSEDKPNHCGSCRACAEHCPTGAIGEEGFRRERCLRFWQLSGKVPPEPIRASMGNLLIGCDTCQRCCPRNPRASADAGPAVPLAELLTQPRGMAARLSDEIGANLALPNRLLTQGCLIAGNSGDRSLLPLLEPLAAHPSPAVREAAAWAISRLAE